MPTNEGLRTTLTGTSQEILKDVKDELIDYETPDMIFRSLVTRGLSTDEGGKVVLTVRKQAMSAQEIPEGAVPDYQHADFKTIEVDVKEYGIHTGVTRIMLEDSRLDEIANATLEARRAMDRKINELVVEELKTGWYNADTDPPDYGANTFTSSHDHIKQVASANTALAVDDIAEGVELVNEHGYTADTLIINPGQLKDLQATAAWDNSTGVASGIRDELVRAGFMGRILGLDIFVNAWIPDKKFVVMDRSVRPIALVERRPLTIDEGDAGFGIVDSYYSWRGGVGTVLEGAGCYLSLA